MAFTDFSRDAVQLAQHLANRPEKELARILAVLQRSPGAVRKTKALAAIIARLERWRNRP